MLVVVREKIANPAVAEVLQRYPAAAQKKLMVLRHLVLETATEIPGLGELEETLKWGEPSYISAIGSTIRIGWKIANPHQCALYFDCKTTLVKTFTELYSDVFRYSGNRALIFTLNGEIPVAPLKHCIALALTYKRRKHLPLLGA